MEDAVAAAVANTTLHCHQPGEDTSTVGRPALPATTITTTGHRGEGGGMGGAIMPTHPYSCWCTL